MSDRPTRFYPGCPSQFKEEHPVGGHNEKAMTAPKLPPAFTAIGSYTPDQMHAHGLACARWAFEAAAKVAEGHFIYGHSVAGPGFAAAGAAAIRAKAATLKEGK